MCSSCVGKAIKDNPGAIDKVKHYAVKLSTDEVDANGSL